MGIGVRPVRATARRGGAADRAESTEVSGLFLRALSRSARARSMLSESRSLVTAAAVWVVTLLETPVTSLIVRTKPEGVEQCEHRCFGPSGTDSKQRCAVCVDSVDLPNRRRCLCRRSSPPVACDRRQGRVGDRARSGPTRPTVVDGPPRRAGAGLGDGSCGFERHGRGLAHPTRAR